MEQLRSELEDEKRQIALLRQPIEELKLTTVTEDNDEEIIDNKEAKGDEAQWKIRFESQENVNETLMNEAAALKEKIANEKSRLKTLAQGGELEEYKGSNARKTLIKLTREKQNLQSQLKDYEWRLDQEADAYQKAEDKKQTLLKDISQAKAKSHGSATNKSAKRGSVLPQSHRQTLAKLSKPSQKRKQKKQWSKFPVVTEIKEHD